MGHGRIGTGLVAGGAGVIAAENTGGTRADIADKISDI